MFIKKLYSYSKVLFFVLMLFIISFIYLFYKWGVVATPVYEFGMYSKVQHVSDTQNIYRIFVNDSLVDMGKIYFPKRDILLVSLADYQMQNQENKNVFEVMRNFFIKTRLSSFNLKNFTNNISDADFLNWYKTQLQNFLHIPVNKIELYSQQFLWKPGGFVQISSLKKEFFVAN
jgi:hypothetical protein